MSRAPSTRVSQPEFYRLTRAMETLLESDPEAAHLSYDQMAEKLSAVIGTTVAASTISSACKTLGVTIGRARLLAENATGADELRKLREDVAALRGIVTDLTARVRQLEDAATDHPSGHPLGTFRHANGGHVSAANSADRKIS